MIGSSLPCGSAKAHFSWGGEGDMIAVVRFGDVGRRDERTRCRAKEGEVRH